MMSCRDLVIGAGYFSLPGTPVWTKNECWGNPKQPCVLKGFFMTIAKQPWPFLVETGVLGNYGLRIQAKDGIVFSGINIKLTMG